MKRNLTEDEIRILALLHELPAELRRLRFPPACGWEALSFSAGFLSGAIETYFREHPVFSQEFRESIDRITVRLLDAQRESDECLN
jgi:hypothetical protein